jgi:hypothetical protein
MALYFVAIWIITAMRDLSLISLSRGLLLFLALGELQRVAPRAQH